VPGPLLSRALPIRAAVAATVALLGGNAARASDTSTAPAPATAPATASAPATSPAPVTVRRWSYSVAYLGEFLLHPGVLAGIELPLSTSRWRVRQGAFLAAANAGTYIHFRNHVGVRIDAQAGYRFTFGSGVFVEGFAGLGYLHTFLGADVYEVSDDGRVSQVTDWGRPAFMPTASLGGGFNWQRARIAPFLRVEAFGQYPFNDNMLPHFALLLGARL
jgi:hypothetical protein